MPHGRSATDSRMPFLHEPLLSGAFKAAEAQRSTLGSNQDGSYNSTGCDATCRSTISRNRSAAKGC